MIKTPQIVIFTLVFFLMPVMASYAHAQNEDLVGSVKIEGNKRVETSTLLYYIKPAKGNLFPAVKSVKTLNRYMILDNSRTFGLKLDKAQKGWR